MDFGHDIHACFGGDYAECRARFRVAAMAAGGRPAAHRCPATGPLGETLHADSAWFGSVDAECVLVLVSGVHGVEGFCGSGAQIDWLEAGGPRRLPAGVAALLVHGLNPHGFAWLRRVTHEGVDLNRNFVDFTRPLVPNPDYAELADAIVPPALDGPVFEWAMERLAEFRRRRGEHAFQVARSSGQHTHPTGHAFAGNGPTWARNVLEGLMAEHRLASRARVAVIDYHTGQGPFGYGEPICGHEPESPGHRRAKAWYGDSLTEPALGTSTSVPKRGVAEEGWLRVVGDPVVYVALEFGTYGVDHGIRVLREDYWLYAHGTPRWGKAETARIGAEMRKRYYPDSDDWREMVIFRSRQVIGQALRGLVDATA